MKSRKAIIGLTVAGLVLSAASSNAQLNLTGGSVVASLTGQELIGISGGPPALPVCNVGINDGAISTWVVSDSSLDQSGLIFIYQVVNNGPDAIDNVELTGFSNSQVLSTAQDACVTGLTLTGSLTPTGSPFGSENTFGGTVTFENGNLNTDNTSSDFLVVYTDASDYGTNYGQIEDSFSAQGATLADGAVPEANTILAGALMLLPLGIGAVRAIRKERALSPE